MPLVALEAVSLWAPVLASSVGGFAGAHHRWPRRLPIRVLRNAAAARRRSREEPHAHPMERRSLSLTARRTILERFSLERTVSEYERIFLA